MGCSVTVIDDLSTGNRDAAKECEFIHGNIGSPKFLEDVFSKNCFEAVFHFAAFSQVGESVNFPLRYFRNNVSNTATLLHAMEQANVNNLVYSSSASVYGNIQSVKISEFDPVNPINPYGFSKRVVEKLIEDCSAASDLNAVCFRYFNAAGADPEGELGECHEPETHLIPLVLKVASGEREEIQIYGDDYDTPDGTCIRDYIHVWDLCEAHWMGLLHIIKTNKTSIYNLGNGEGASVYEVIKCAEKVTGREVKSFVSDRRAGDPPRLVADSSLANKELLWRPKYSDLSQIIRDAWRWEIKR